MKYPYIKFRGKYLPLIPIKFRLKNRDRVEFKAYVDSGAGYSIFHAGITEILGLTLEDGKEDYVTVGDGSQIKVYIHQIKVHIADNEFKATIAFSRHLGIGFNIIGRFDIFDRFKICFDESKKIMEFYPKVSKLE